MKAKLLSSTAVIGLVAISPAIAETVDRVASFVGAASLVNLKDGMAALVRHLREPDLALPAVG